jgi:tetratricopeptide (TPR) repeat protein
MAKGVKPIQRVKKKELKEDKLVTTFFQARDYLDDNKKTIIRIGGAAVLIIALVSFWIYSKSSGEYQASYEMGIVLAEAQTGDPVSLAGKFEQIADRYRGTAAGNEALLFAAQMHLMADKSQNAIAAYELYLDKGRHSPYLFTSALVGKAACLEDLNRYTEAADAYLEAATATKGFFLAPRFHLDAARCYRLAGDRDEAVAQCELVQVRYAESPFAAEAEKELKRL